MCTKTSALETCESCRRRKGFLPSDGSGIDPHATPLAVQPVTRTGQRERRGGRVGSVDRPRLFINGNGGRRTAGPGCCVSSSRTYASAGRLLTPLPGGGGGGSQTAMLQARCDATETGNKVPLDAYLGIVVIWAHSASEPPSSFSVVVSPADFTGDTPRDATSPHRAPCSSCAAFTYSQKKGL